jgi:hypothetical protein
MSAGWLQWGLLNCAEWLHWRCDLSLSAAREKVRVTHALKTLPAISLAFSRGELSYSKVRAFTCVARSDNEDGLIAFALKTTTVRSRNVAGNCAAVQRIPSPRQIAVMQSVHCVSIVILYAAP